MIFYTRETRVPPDSQPLLLDRSKTMDPGRRAPNTQVTPDTPSVPSPQRENNPNRKSPNGK